MKNCHQLLMGHIWMDILTQNQCGLIEQNRQPKNNTHTALVYGMYMMKLVVLICLVFLKKSWTITRFKTSTFGLLLLKIVVKLTFFSNAIPVLKICMLLLFATLLLMLLCYFLVQVETNVSRSRGEKVDLISLLFFC